MNIPIETYRGFEICFDPNKDEFYLSSSSWDTEFKSKSFTGAKKKVDDHIKDNVDFKPFWVVNKQGKRKKVIGIRKDGLFMAESASGGKEQIPQYENKYLFLERPEFAEVFAQWEAVALQENEYRIKRMALEDSISGESLDSIKDNYPV